MDVDVAGTYGSPRRELDDEVRVEGVPRGTGEIADGPGHQSAHVVFDAHQMHGGRYAQHLHGCGRAHARTAEGDALGETARELGGEAGWQGCRTRHRGRPS